MVETVLHGTKPISLALGNGRNRSRAAVFKAAATDS